MRILCIAPNAPPRNSAEAIQVGRYLAELSLQDDVLLVTEPEPGGWIRDDDSASLDRFDGPRFEMSLPAHRFVMRALAHPAFRFLSRRLEHWPRLFARRVAAWGAEADIIYSRSSPYRAATLAAAVKTLTGKPWVMHLSDPWVDNPYGTWTGKDREFEAELEHLCLEEADLITLTTEIQANHYRRKYPRLAPKIHVSPNVLPRGLGKVLPKRGGLRGRGVRIIYTGALYGERDLSAFYTALARIGPDLRKRIRLIIAGHASDAAQSLMQAHPDTTDFLGHVSADEARALNQSADYLLMYEPPAVDPLARGFLPSKLLDYLSTGVPILAITPSGSASASIVANRFGRCFDPTQTEALAAYLAQLAGDRGDDRCESGTIELPGELYPQRAVAELRSRMKKVLAS